MALRILIRNDGKIVYLTDDRCPCAKRPMFYCESAPSEIPAEGASWAVGCDYCGRPLDAAGERSKELLRLYGYFVEE